MIIEYLIKLIIYSFNFILSILPSIPSLPASFTSSLTAYIDLLVSNGLGLFYFFVRPSTVAIVIPIIIFINSFEYIYAFIIWILKKIPFLGIK